MTTTAVSISMSHEDWHAIQRNLRRDAEAQAALGWTETAISARATAARFAAFYAAACEVAGSTEAGLPASIDTAHRPAVEPEGR